MQSLLAIEDLAGRQQNAENKLDPENENENEKE